MGRWARGGHWDRTGGPRGGNKGRGVQLGGRFGLTASQPERGGRRRICLGSTSAGAAPVARAGTPAAALVSEITQRLGLRLNYARIIGIIRYN